MSPYFQSKDTLHKNKWNNGYGLQTFRGANNYIGLVPQQPVINKKAFDLTDTGNAHRFIDEFGDVLRYNIDNKMWMIWNGNFWQYDAEEYVKNYIEIMAEKMTIESAGINDMQVRLRYLSDLQRPQLGFESVST